MMMKVKKKDSIGKVYEKIPIWEKGKWSEISFETREEFKKKLEEDCYKEPGEYKFDKIVKEFQAQGLKYKQDKYYCDFTEGSRDFIKYWDFEKLKCRKGCFFKKGKRTYYLPRDYYQFINFAPIVNKITKTEDFPDIHDAQYHMALYEWIGELDYKHGVILKKRQFGSSFYHANKLINLLWFETKPVLRIGASLSAYITGVNGTWKMLNEYRNFLNKQTAWYRPMNPG